MNSDESHKHPLQRLMDNPWILLALGVLVPFISYTAWGMWEIFHTPPDLLP